MVVLPHLIPNSAFQLGGHVGQRDKLIMLVGPGDSTNNQTVMSGTPSPETPEKSDD